MLMRIKSIASQVYYLVDGKLIQQIGKNGYEFITKLILLEHLAHGILPKFSFNPTISLDVKSISERS